MRINEQILLSHLHKSISDGGITMRVELHSVAHDISHLIISAVIHTLHGVKNTALHRLQAVLDMGHGTLQDYIRCVIQEPVLVHPTQMMHRRCVKAIGGPILRVCLFGIFGLHFFLHSSVFILLRAFCDGLRISFSDSFFVEVCVQVFYFFIHSKRYILIIFFLQKY